MTPRVFKFAAVPNSKSAIGLRPYALSFEDFTADLATSQEGTKEGPAIIPAVFRPCPSRCIGPRFDCGGGALHRLKELVVEMTAFVADLDTGITEDFEALRADLGARGLCYWWWQTFSHTPEAPKGRILIPFHKPMRLPSPRAWSYIAWPALMESFGLSTGGARADPACRDPGRLYYLPRHAPGARPREGGFIDGQALDWRGALGDRLALFQTTATASALVNVPGLVRTETTAPVSAEVLADIRDRLKRYAKCCPPLKRAAIEAALEGRLVTPLPADRPVGGLPRNLAYMDLTLALAKTSANWVASESLLETFIRASWMAEVMASPDDVTPWDRVEDMLLRARAKVATERAQEAAEAALFVGNYSKSPAAQIARERLLRADRLRSSKKGATR